VSMSQFDWRSANRLEPDGVAKTEVRVVGDVVQHQQMLKVLAYRKMLRPPRRWSKGVPS
jgi:hypothetical protein